MSTITREQAQKIIEAADEVITALAGTNEDVHPESDNMLRLWDDLNDRYAPPEVVRELARIALVSLEAKAVAFVMADDLKDGGIISTPAYRDLGEAMERTVGDVVALYAIHPAPLSLDAGGKLSNFISSQELLGKDFEKVLSENIEGLYVPGNSAQPAPLSVLDAATAIRACMEEFPESVHDIVEECAAIAESACRAAMLQGAEPVTTANKLPANTPCKEAPEHIWLQTAGVWPENGEFSELTWCSDNQHEDDTLYVRADVAAGNSPVIPDGWVACSERMPEVGVKVLCFPVNDEPIHATYNGQLWLQDISWSTSDEPIDNVISCNVFHWMPMPAAPQQE